jgi:hypothetical protein
MSSDKRPTEKITRIDFAYPVRFPDEHRTQLKSWSLEHHETRCRAELGPGNSVILRGSRGLTIVLPVNVHAIECFAEP